MAERYLGASEAARVYDRIGHLQDTQRLYERRAVDELVRRGEFGSAGAVVEFGCGTGRLAERLLAGELPPHGRYLGVDVSPRMVALAERRLRRFGQRAEVRLSTGAARLAERDGSFDRVVACYLLDLLAPAEIEALLDEAWRLLGREGRLCLVSLTYGSGGAAKLVTRVWRRVWKLRPQLVGGCRPLELLEYLDDDRWVVGWPPRVVSSFGVPSEVLVARPR